MIVRMKSQGVLVPLDVSADAIEQAAHDVVCRTHTLGTLMVTSMFKEFQIGRATAIAVVLFTLVFAISVGVRRALKREAIET